MNPAAFRDFNSTYFVNRRRKEAIIQPLQRIITDHIAEQLNYIATLRARLSHNHIALPQDLSEDNSAASFFDDDSVPSLQSLTLDSIFRQQEVTLQEIRAQTERSIDIVLADTEDIDPLSNDWHALSLTKYHQGPRLVKDPTIYLPLEFYRVKDLQGNERSIPANPSEFLPTDEAYFQATGALDPPKYIVPSNHSYLETSNQRTYTTNNADLQVNKFYCRLEPPPPLSNQSLSLPHQGNTYLQDGSPYYKKLDKGDTIYIPHLTKYGKVKHWKFGIVVYQPTWIFQPSASSTCEHDHWSPVTISEPTEQVSFGLFVIKVPSIHPTRPLLAYVSPYTASDSDFLV